MKTEVMRMSGAEIVNAQVSAEIDTQIATAKQYPRDIVMFKKKCTELATMDEVTAEKCLFSLPRDGKTIEGKTIRLAELVAHTYGNLRIQSRMVEEGETHITVQGICHDLETNVAFSSEVRRSVSGNKGRFSDGMVTLTVNAAMAIAQRNAIFKCVPEVLINEIENGIKEKMLLDDSQFEDRKEKAFAFLKTKGMDESMIFTLLGIDDASLVTQAHLRTIRGIATGIQTGEFTADDIISGLKKRNDATDFRAEAGKKKKAEAQAAQKEKGKKDSTVNSEVDGAEDFGK